MCCMCGSTFDLSSCLEIRKGVPVKSSPVSGIKFLTLWWASLTITKRIKAQLSPKKKRKKKTVRLHSETPAQNKKVISKQEKIEPTCRSWSPNAPSSVCLRGRHHRHRRHPQRHFRLNHTKHCSPKAGGKAERKRGIKVRGKKIILVLYNTVCHTNRLSV